MLPRLYYGIMCDIEEFLLPRAFVMIAEELGLWVILRPGPYVCAGKPDYDIRTVA